jgi:hypothetical protein
MRKSAEACRAPKIFNAKHALTCFRCSVALPHLHKKVKCDTLAKPIILIFEIVSNFEFIIYIFLQALVKNFLLWFKFLIHPQIFIRKVLGCFRTVFCEYKIATDGDLRVDLGEKQEVFRE